MILLLTREAFRELALERDGNRCVCCGRTDELSVHHILERKLFPDGGYYLDNAASLCPGHHLQAEITTLSVEDVRAAAGILTVVMPPGWDPHLRYDKWGNVMQPDGTRLAGPLIQDDGCRKALRAGGALSRIRYR